MWAIVIIVWAIYRSYFRTDLPQWIDEFIAKPIIFVLPVFYFIKRYEKRSFFGGLDFHLNSLLPDLLIGGAIGLIFLSMGILGNYMNMGVFIPPEKQIFLTDAIMFTALALATGLTEEILTRGFVLKRLYNESKNIYTSSFLVSILFFFMHIPILFTDDNIRGALLIQIMITDMILSLVVSLLYLERRSLLVPVLIHMFYNLSLYVLAKGT